MSAPERGDAGRTTTPEWGISELARLAGTTSRTLRHYGDVGLLAPSRIGANGYRYYDSEALVRLQRILLLRELGLGLPAIGQVLAERSRTTQALAAHLNWLRSEQQRLGRQVAAVQRTIDNLEEGRPLMAEESLDGFDHTQYREEVEQRWGRQAYRDSDRWWRSKTDDERQRFFAEQGAIAAAFGAAKRDGLAPDSDDVQAIVARHVAWLTGIPGTPQTPSGQPAPQYVTGLAEAYVADDRFRVNYDVHAPGTAELIRDAVTAYYARP